MNRTYLQAIAILMGTAVTTFVAAEWRWEPENTGHYLISVGPGSSAAIGKIAAGATRQGRESFAGNNPDFR